MDISLAAPALRPTTVAHPTSHMHPPPFCPLLSVDLSKLLPSRWFPQGRARYPRVRLMRAGDQLEESALIKRTPMKMATKTTTAAVAQESHSECLSFVQRPVLDRVALLRLLPLPLPLHLPHHKAMQRLAVLKPTQRHLIIDSRTAQEPHFAP